MLKPSSLLALGWAWERNAGCWQKVGHAFVIGVVHCERYVDALWLGSQSILNDLVIMEDDDSGE